MKDKELREVLKRTGVLTSPHYYMSNPDDIIPYPVKEILDAIINHLGLEISVVHKHYTVIKKKDKLEIKGHPKTMEEAYQIGRRDGRAEAIKSIETTSA